MSNILHITTGTNIGGAEIVLERTLSAFDKERFENSVLSLLPPGPVAENIAALGIRVDSLRMKRGLPGPLTLFRFLTIMQREKPDVIQGWMYHGSIAATGAWRLKRKRPPLIWSIHHSLNDIAQEPKMTQRIIRRLAAWSDQPAAILYCSETSRRQHEAVGFNQDRAIVIPNGIDTSAFKPDPAARARLLSLLGVSQASSLIAVIARVDPMKDHANAVRAAAGLVRNGKDVQLIFIGRDATPSNAELNSIIETEGIAENVHLLGQRSDIPSLVPGLDILLSSSAWGEAFPLAVSEAMSAGVPCVATDLGDCAYLIGDTGHIVPPRDPDALAQALASIIDMSDEQKRDLGLKARQRIETNFALNAVTKLYENVYDDVLAQR